MKPNFALSLSFEGISLLHRVPSGWHLVGEAGLDSVDLSAELSVLRSTAQALDKSGLRSKLVIPNDQIRYLVLDTGGAAGEVLQTRIREALDGATPYAVDELAFDWRTEAGETRVAAVAQETLIEAEAFAVEHKFHPVSFVSVSEDGAWEPYFGPTAHAATLLPPGETVIPDADALRIVGRARLPSTERAAEIENEAPAVVEALEEPQEAESEPASDPAQVPVAVGISAEPDDAGDTAQAPVKTEPAPADPEPAAEQGHDHAHDEAAPGSGLDITPGPDADGGPRPPRIGVSIGPGPNAPDAATEASAAASVTFASVRARRDATAAPAAPRLGGVVRDAEPEAHRLPSIAAPTIPDPDPPAPTGAARVTVENDSAGTAASMAESTIASLQRPAPEPASEKPAPARATWRLSERGRMAVAAATAERDAAEEAGSETRRMTVFGARSAEPVRGKPKYLGLILTVLLLLFLAGVAVWAAVDRNEGIAGLRGGNGPLISVLATPEAIEETPVPLPEPVVAPEARALPEPTEPTGDPDAADDLQLAALDIGISDTEAGMDDPALAEPGAPAPVTPEEAETRYAATGIWQLAPDQGTPPAAAGLNDLYIASIDPVVPEYDPVALPAPDTGQTDFAFRDPGTPPPPGTDFDFGSDGLVIATPDGAVTPQGVTVYAGRPPLVPPVREPDTSADTADSVDETIERMRLAGFRPRPRPEDLVEQTERTQLGGLTRTELATLRPRLRPEALKEAEEQEQQDAPPTAQAVAASVVPAPRPGNFDRIVRQAERTPDPQPTRTASVAPRSVTPSIPSNASVARQATVSNAINLRRINLIGVYGKPSSRRALVRLSNGRYQKVQIGDRIDGGRVAAIGDSELRYTKGGRSVVLTLPQG